MIDIGWPELLIIMVIALVVIGPKDLPKALYTVGKWVRAARKMSTEFQRHVDDMVRDTELEEVKKGIDKARSFNVKREMEKAVDPDGSLSDSLSDQKGKRRSDKGRGDATAAGKSWDDQDGGQGAITANGEGRSSLPVPSAADEAADDAAMVQATSEESRPGSAAPPTAARRSPRTNNSKTGAAESEKVETAAESGKDRS